MLLFSRIGVGICCVLLSLGCVSQSQYDAQLAKNEKLQAELENLQGDSERAKLLDDVKASFARLKERLDKLTDLGLEINIRKNRMVVSLPGDVLFSSGKDELSEGGLSILGQVAEAIREDKDLAERHYQVAGHTDSARIKNEETVEQFQDNWGLSLMRARRVLLFLIAKPGSEGGGGGLNPKHWSASGYGSTDPIANNAQRNGRQKNRRVELILMPSVGEMLDLKSLMDEAAQED